MRKNSALTLIELLIAILLISTLVGAIWAVYDVGSRSFQSRWTRSGLKGEVGRALTYMGRGLRISTAVTTSSATALTFTADLDGNGSDDTVQYAWSGVPGEPLNRTLITTVPAATTTDPAIRSVSSATFTYYDASNAATTTPASVRVVSINLTAAGTNESFTLRANFKLRNLP